MNANTFPINIHIYIYTHIVNFLYFLALYPLILKVSGNTLSLFRQLLNAAYTSVGSCAQCSLAMLEPNAPLFIGQ